MEDTKQPPVEVKLIREVNQLGTIYFFVEVNGNYYPNTMMHGGNITQPPDELLMYKDKATQTFIQIRDNLQLSEPRHDVVEVAYIQNSIE